MKSSKMNIGAGKGSGLSGIVQRLEYEIGHECLRWDDLITALYFFQDPDNKKGIIMQVCQVVDLPYIRRGLMVLLGEPSSIIGNTFAYGEKRIVLASLSQAPEALYGYRLPTFYVASARVDAEQEFLEHQGITPEVTYDHILNLWCSVGISPSHMAQGLCYDGVPIEVSKSIVSKYFSLMAYGIDLGYEWVGRCCR